MWLTVWMTAMVLLIPALAGACAVCWIGASSPDHDALARGFYWGLLFLMAMPFAVVGSIAGWLFYTHRKDRLRSSRPRAVEMVPDSGKGRPLRGHLGVVELEPGCGKDQRLRRYPEMVKAALGYRKEGGN